MCGIAGLVDLKGDHVPLTPVERMTDAMVHRGPNSAGFLHTGPVALGMRRLAIIDLGGGDQPIYSEDRMVAVISNGEIYNYRELTLELEQAGHRFATRSDTEVIVHAYEMWGENCLQRLRGMFAFAIVDQRPSGTEVGPTILLARDRFGIKPLYYYQDGAYLLFASEVRALLMSGLVPRQLSTSGLQTYLAYGSVQEPLTLVSGVRSLLPGHTLSVRSGRCDIRRYWNLPQGTARVSHDELPAVQRHVGELLAESVQLELVSDVPLGVFLSGGIDSGAVAGLAAQTSAEPLRTFTISFAERSFDESDLAETAARRLGTRHETIVIRSSEVLSDLPQALLAMDQPTIDGINTWYVSRAAKRAGVTVALSGLGGDELFAGYQHFDWLPTLITGARRARSAPLVLRRSAARVIESLPLTAAPRERLAALLRDELPGDHPYFISRLWFTPGQQRALLPGTAESDPEARLWHNWLRACVCQASRYDAIGAISYLECTQYMLSRLLRDTDFMSMAHSLEVRVPLLDHKLAETVIGLPGRLKRPGAGTNKPLLVAGATDVLTPEAVRQPKRTFTFPWATWLCSDLRNEVEGVLERPDGPLRELLDVRAVRSVWRGFLSGRYSWSRPWGLYVLDRWCRTYL